MKKILVVQRRLTHYRVPFFRALYKEMADRGMELLLAYGESSIEEVKKNDSGMIEWATNLKTTYYFGDKICWQPFFKLAKEADVIVIAHENKLIFNLLIQWFSKKKVILWGHGQNLQREKPDIRDKFKKITACKADWWFGYTAYSLPLIKKNGFPENRITILNNSIDTLKLTQSLENISKNYVDSLRSKYNLNSEIIGIYIGSMYSEKCIEFLIKSIMLIKSKSPEFQFIFAGDGPDRELVESYANNFNWIKYVGSVHGIEKAALLSISKIILNPGAIGLGVLDSFASQVPIVTTECGLHGPEIAYLFNQENSLITEYDIDSYVTAVLKLIENEKLYSLLSMGCKNSAALYSIENMAKNFTDGVEQCINSIGCRYVS